MESLRSAPLLASPRSLIPPFPALLSLIDAATALGTPRLVVPNHAPLSRLARLQLRLLRQVQRSVGSLRLLRSRNLNPSVRRRNLSVGYPPLLLSLSPPQIHPHCREPPVGIQSREPRGGRRRFSPSSKRSKFRQIHPSLLRHHLPVPPTPASLHPTTPSPYLPPAGRMSSDVLLEHSGLALPSFSSALEALSHLSPGTEPLGQS
jgi:hypothetical protein